MQTASSSVGWLPPSQTPDSRLCKRVSIPSSAANLDADCAASVLTLYASGGPGRYRITALRTPRARMCWITDRPVISEGTPI